MLLTNRQTNASNNNGLLVADNVADNVMILLLLVRIKHNCGKYDTHNFGLDTYGSHTEEIFDM